jgi:hypothetical protein
MSQQGTNQQSMTNDIANSEIVHSNHALAAQVSSVALASIDSQTRELLLRMFADPYLLEKEDRAILVEQLRDHVAQFPDVPELRVLLGMALCVNFEVPPAIQELKESVRLAPGSFIAQLKLGELWMRLRVCDQAEEHTRAASRLAQNLAQVDLARKQAAAIRTMKRRGVERGGYKLPFASVSTSLRSLWNRWSSDAVVTEN